MGPALFFLLDVVAPFNRDGGTVGMGTTVVVNAQPLRWRIRSLLNIVLSMYKLFLEMRTSQQEPPKNMTQGLVGPCPFQTERNV